VVIGLTYLAFRYEGLRYEDFDEVMMIMMMMMMMMMLTTRTMLVCDDGLDGCDCGCDRGGSPIWCSENSRLTSLAGHTDHDAAVPGLRQGCGKLKMHSSWKCAFASWS
jgi:hypothetical protein